MYGLIVGIMIILGLTVRLKRPIGQPAEKVEPKNRHYRKLRFERLTQSGWEKIDP